MHIFTIIFTILLIISTIYTYAKKQYVYLFIPCMLYLPEYYAIELPSLPLITVTRILYIVFFFFVYFNRRKNIDLKRINPKTMPKEYLFILAYFVLRMISNLYYIFTYSQPIKTIFGLIFEQLGLLIGLLILEPSLREFAKLIKCIVWPAAVLFFVGINESFFRLRPFDLLYTASREILNYHYVRLGMLRSTTTFGMPGLYSNMCIFVFPLILYLYHVTKQKRYLCIIPLNLFAIIHAGSRSNMIFILAIIFIYSVLALASSEHRFSFIKHFLCITFVSSLLILFFMLTNPMLRYYYEGTAKSLLNEVGFNFDLNESTADSSAGYGANYTGGTVSRMSQFTGIQYTLSKNPIFGLGSGAALRGDIMYKWNGEWYYYHTFDVGLVEAIACEGLIGLVAFSFFFIAWLIALIKIFKLSKGLPTYSFALVLPAYLLGTLGTANMYTFMVLFLGLTFIYLRNHQGLDT